MALRGTFRWAGLPTTLITVTALALAPGARAQALVDLKGPIPQGPPANQAFSENVDFADVDLDGDWDAAFASGGECCNQQNRIWINLAGLQGGLPGFFDDQTATRAPLLADDSNDVEFADWDADGDDDLFVSNTSEIANQASRFWTNLGGLQGQSAGYFADETATRWVGLGGAGSSVAASLVVPSGGFIDWSSDADFADLDNDGDLDLIHSSYGSMFGGQTPTRIFENDGSGTFTELNPGQATLLFSTIDPGTPAIWCEGLQMSETSDTTGLFADVALSALDVEVGDLDGDLDLDLVIGDVISQPRVFENRLSETGQLVFRDVTNAALTELTPDVGNYDQELGDLDGDLDLDLFCLGWLTWDNGVTLNDGAGVFGPIARIVDSDKRHVEMTLFDYDNDGDLDAFAVNAGNHGDRLYENDGAAGMTDVSDAQISTGATDPAHGSVAADVNGDGDFEVFVATEDRNQVLWNLTEVPDTTAPTLTRLEQAPDRTAGPAPTIVRVQLFDNVALDRLRSATVWLEVSVDGGPTFDLPMQSSGGGLFRGAILGQLVGTVGYRALALDRQGNAGASTPLSFVAAPGLLDSQNTTYCTAKTTSIGCVPRAQLVGLCSVTATDPCWFLADRILNLRNGLWFYGYGAAALPFYGGTLCVAPPLARSPLQNSGGNPPPADCSGTFAADVNAWIATGSDPNLVAGQQVYAQWWFRDGGDPQKVGLTDAVSFVVQP